MRYLCGCKQVQILHSYCYIVFHCPYISQGIHITTDKSWVVCRFQLLGIKVFFFYEHSGTYLFLDLAIILLGIYTIRNYCVILYYFSPAIEFSIMVRSKGNNLPSQNCKNLFEHDDSSWKSSIRFDPLIYIACDAMIYNLAPLGIMYK